MNKQLLRVGEAADVLAVSRWTIYRWVEDGRLEGTKIGRGQSSAGVSRLAGSAGQRNKTHEMNLSPMTNRNMGAKSRQKFAARRRRGMSALWCLIAVAFMALASGCAPVHKPPSHAVGGTICLHQRPVV